MFSPVNSNSTTTSDSSCRGQSLYDFQCHNLSAPPPPSVFGNRSRNNEVSSINNNNIDNSLLDSHGRVVPPAPIEFKTPTNQKMSPFLHGPAPFVDENVPPFLPGPSSNQNIPSFNLYGPPASYSEKVSLPEPSTIDYDKLLPTGPPPTSNSEKVSIGSSSYLGSSSSHQKMPSFFYERPTFYDEKDSLPGSAAFHLGSSPNKIMSLFLQGVLQLPKPQSTAETVSLFLRKTLPTGSMNELLIEPTASTSLPSSKKERVSVSRIRIWTDFLYNVYTKIDNSNDIIHLAPYNTHFFQRLLIKNTIHITYYENYHLISNMLELLRWTPECRFLLSVRGFCEDFMRFIKTLPRIDGVFLQDVCSNESIHFKELLEILKNVDELSLDMRHIKLSEDPGVTLLQWNRPATLKTFMLYNLAPGTNADAVQKFCQEKLIPGAMCSVTLQIEPKNHLS